MVNETIIKSLSEQYKVELATIKDLWSKLEDNGKGFGYSGDALEKYCQKRVSIFFAKKKIKIGQENPYEIVICGFRFSDFGNNKDFKTAEKAWQSDPEDAVVQGLCNEKGEPLYQKGKRQGEVMNPAEYTVKSCFGVVKKKAEVSDGEEATWEVRKFDVPMSTKIPLGCISEANLSKGAQDGVFYCNTPEFLIKKQLSYKQMLDLATEFFKPEVKIKDAQAWAEEHQGDYNAMCYSIACLDQINKAKKGKSDTVVIADTSDPGNIAVIQGWVSKSPESDITIREGAEEVLIFHCPYKETTNVYGMYADDKYKRKEEPEKITATNGDKDASKEGWDNI